MLLLQVTFLLLSRSATFKIEIANDFARISHSSNSYLNFLVVKNQKNVLDNYFTFKVCNSGLVNICYKPNIGYVMWNTIYSIYHDLMVYFFLIYDKLSLIQTRTFYVAFLIWPSVRTYSKLYNNIYNLKKRRDQFWRDDEFRFNLNLYLVQSLGRTDDLSKEW